MEMRGSGAGGCCIASRYGGNPNSNYYSADPYDLSKMDRIMLRFRPIAPKPVPGGGPPAQPQNDDVKASGKGKRKGSSSNNNKRRKSRSPVKQENSKGHVVTLPLLPEAPDLMSPKDQGRTSSSSTATWLSFGGSDQEEQDPAVVVSSVVVEGVTDTWLDGKGLGCTDEERRMRLMEDTCPGFISDGWNRVWWTNDAYRRMAITGDVNNTWQGVKESYVVVVKLGLREKVELPGEKLYPAFTCRVRVKYGKDGSHWMTVPCDVWKMDGGGYAWRLDVKAALSLGLF